MSLMERSKEINLILGCGERGMDWHTRTSCDSINIPLDRQTFSYPQLNFTVGDALNLPFSNNSIDRIYADFVLNSIEMRGASMKDVIACPQILADENRPEPVRRWFIDTLGKSDKKFEKNMDMLRWILRETTLHEMWRILKENGSMIIIDHAHVVNWLRATKSHIFHLNDDSIEMRMPDISTEDFKRSASLEKLTKNGIRVGKAVIHKFPAQLSLFSKNGVEFRSSN